MLTPGTCLVKAGVCRQLHNVLLDKLRGAGKLRGRSQVDRYSALVLAFHFRDRRQPSISTSFSLSNCFKCAQVAWVKPTGGALGAAPGFGFLGQYLRVRNTSNHK